MENLSADELSNYLKGRGLCPELAEKMKEEEVDGASFSEITPDVLRACSFKAGEIVKIMKFKDLPFLQQLKPSNESTDDYAELKQYFEPDEFNNISTYEKDSYLTQLQRYNHAKESDFADASRCMPVFVSRHNEKQLKQQRAKQRELARQKKEENKLPPTRRSVRQASCASEAGSATSDSMSLRVPSPVKAASPRPLGAAASSSYPSASSTSAHAGGVNPASRHPSRSRSPTPPGPSGSQSAPQTGIASPSTSLSREGDLRRTAQFAFGRSSSDESDNNEVQGNNADFEELPFSTTEVTHSEEQLQVLSKDCELPNYNMYEILNTIFQEGKQNIKEAILQLKAGCMTPLQRKRVMRALALYLYYKVAKRPQDVTPNMKEGMAKSFVVAFPGFIVTSSDGRKPWGLIFNRNGTGFLANACRAPQAANPKHPKKIKRGKENVQPGAQNYGPDFIQELAVTMPDRANHAEILEAMHKTFDSRQSDRSKGISIREMLEKFPHLGSYEGEVLREEFKRLHPGSKDGSKEFLKLLPQILALPEKRPINIKCKDDAVKALVLLNQYLPHDVRKNNSSVAKIEDLIEVLKTGDDIEEFLEGKVADAKGPIQPYLVLIRATIGNHIIRSFLVLDKKPVQLPSTTFKAVDALFKAFFVFNVNYPIGWNNVFHFLATCFYGVFETKRKRRDCIAPNEHALFTQIGGRFS